MKVKYFNRLSDTFPSFMSNYKLADTAILEITAMGIHIKGKKINKILEDGRFVRSFQLSKNDIYSWIEVSYKSNLSHNQTIYLIDGRYFGIMSLLNRNKDLIKLINNR